MNRQEKQPPAFQPGEIPPGPSESRLHVNPAPPADADRLQLPRGGWIAMRKSGGLKFRWRQVVVYRSGRMQSSSSEAVAHTRQLEEAEMASLGDALAGVNFRQLARTAGRPSPDGYTYEIVARIGRRAYAIETFDGSIPAPLEPLIQQLNRLMPPEAIPAAEADPS